jgi:peptide/nickel transport system substrate-binding protein
MHLPSRPSARAAAITAIAALPLMAAGCGGGGSTPASGSGGTPATGGGGATGTLIIDTSFIAKTLDPQRDLQPTALMANKASYDTLMSSKGADTAPQPSVAQSVTASKDAKTYTFKLRSDVVFSDGTPLTSKDVVFSFRRLVGLNDSPGFLLAGVTTTAPDATTVVLKSKTPNPAIPSIVTSPALGIVNSTVVKAHGGDDSANAAKLDKAEKFLNANSAGSGPYILKSFTTNDKITLAVNPKYWGTKPAFEDVVLRNMQAPTQLLNIQRGTNEIALDLSAQQATSVKSNSKLQVATSASPNLFTLQTNQDPKISPVTANPKIQEAIRNGINYAGMVATAGAGAVQAAGIIPIQFLGGLPTDEAFKGDVNKAKQLVAESGIKDPSINLNYPSDISVNGLQFATLAQRVAADLGAIGIKVKLVAEPVATFLPKYAAGKDQMAQSYWGPDYADPNDYLVFAPGGSVAARMNWKTGADPAIEDLAKQAGSTSDDAVRKDLFTQIQQKMNVQSPWIPLIQPAQAIVGSSNLTGVVLNPIWTLDISAVAAK